MKELWLLEENKYKTEPQLSDYKTLDNGLY